MAGLPPTVTLAQGKHRHGYCELVGGCEHDAIYRTDKGKACKHHLPETVVFAPFLGQQEKFFARKERVVFLGGAAGGGKSLLLLMKWMQILDVELKRYREAKEKGIEFISRAWGIYFRRTTPDLEQIKQLAEKYFKAADPDATINEQKGIWTFPNAGNAKFQFAHLEHEKDKFRHKSREYVYIAWDELTSFTETQYDYIETRLRTSDPVLEPLMQICAASNPDGEGLLWVRRRFIKIAKPEQVVRIETTLRDGRVVTFEQVFIPARLEDNPILMESGQYEANLINKKPEVRRALLEGDWDVVSGSFLAGFWEPARHVVEPHAFPSGARIFRSCHLGIRTPTSIGYFYEDEAGALVLFGHFRLIGRTPEWIAEKLKAYETRLGLWDERNDESRLNRVKNPLTLAAFGRGDNASIQSEARAFMLHGIRWTRAKQGPDWRRHIAAHIVRRLATTISPDFIGAVSVTEASRAGLRIVQGCKSPLETLPSLVEDKNDPDEVSDAGDLSDWNMIGFACLENPIQLAEDADDDDDDDDDDQPRRRPIANRLIRGVPVHAHR